MLLGRRAELPSGLLERFPELARVAWRTGGVVPRAAALFMGSRGVAAVTLWRVVFLARGVTPSPALLLHELRHVEQFEESAAFPFAYLWEQLRRGYEHNRFEVDARRYAARRLSEASDSRPI
jgi:hypothetical protein